VTEPTAPIPIADVTHASIGVSDPGRTMACLRGGPAWGGAHR
jgi:hypothetical protein